MIEIKGMITMALFDWEQRKLGDMANILRGASPRPIKDKKWFDTNSRIGWIRISDVTSQNGRVYTLGQHLSKKGQEKTRVVSSQTLLLSIAASVGYPVITYVETGVHDGFVIFDKPKFNLDFMFFKLQSIQNIWNKYGQAGSQVNINSSIVANTSISIPNIEEQKRISILLKKIEENIYLQQRKLEQINLLNQAMLQQMFANKDVPKIRFKEFKSIWEHRKLDSLAEFSKGKGYSKKDLITKGKPIILYGQLYTKYQTIIKKIDTFAKTNKESVISRGREVIVPASGETADDISRASVVDKAGIIIGGDLNIIRPYSIISPIFLAFTLSNGTQRKELSKYAQGKSVVHLHNADLKNVNVFLPTMEEQSKINSILSELNELNLLSKNKLAILQAIKNALLQIMFV